MARKSGRNKRGGEAASLTVEKDLMAKKSGRNKRSGEAAAVVSEDAMNKHGGEAAAEEEDTMEKQKRAPLQAILLADSFDTKFHPITLERPKVLLPLVNGDPMIDYTLSWLESAGIKEVFVFCCAHSEQIIEYLENSEWFGQPNFSITTIKSKNCFGAGDALREIYMQEVIKGDFVLVSGDTVGDIELTEAFREHEERRRKDSEAIMTMVVKNSKPSPVTGQSPLWTDDDDQLFMAIHPDTKQLLYYYEDKSNDHSSNDKQDCYIDICDPEVLSIFAVKFHYQHLRRDFVKDLLLDDLMGYKIFTHQIHDSNYAARVDNFRSYDTVSKIKIRDMVPHEVQFSAQFGPSTVIGRGTIVGTNTEISNSVIGKGCKIGFNVSIDGCYIWDNVTIEDGCKLMHAIVCDGVIMKAGATLESGVVLSYNVVVGQNFVVPAYSKVSLYRQPLKQDSDEDEDVEYADNSSGTIETSPISSLTDKLNEQLSMNLSQSQLEVPFEVGHGGAGFIWTIPTTRELEPESNSEDDNEEFEKEVEETFLRAVHEVQETFHWTVVDSIILKVNQSRFFYSLKAADCAVALFYSMMRLAHNTPHGSPSELFKNTKNVITKWEKLVKYFLSTIDEEIEVIKKFEEMCLESTQEYCPIFVKILQLLYDKEIIQEEAILKWASEKEGAEESHKNFVKRSEKFIQWLNEASEED